MYRTKLVMGEGSGNFETQGLLIKNWHWADPLCLDYVNFKEDNAFNLIAHDVLEHIGKQTGSVEDELRAFGAIMFGRFNMGMIYGEHSLGCEIGSFLRPDIKTVKRPKIHHDVLSYADGLCDGIQAEIKYAYPDCDFKTIKKRVLHWISVGYRQAERRYKDSTTLTNIFIKLSYLLKEKLRHVEFLKHVNIAYNPKTEFVNVRVVEHKY